MLILPRRFTQQPQGAVEVAPEYAGRFANIILPPIGNKNLLSGADSGQYPATPGPGGLGFAFSGSSTVSAGELYATTGDFTAFAVVSTTDASKSQVCFYESDGSGGATYNGFGAGSAPAREIHFGFNAGVPLFTCQRASAPSGATVTGSTSIASNKVYVLAMRARGSTLEAWTNGVYEGAFTDGAISGTRPANFFRMAETGYPTAGRYWLGHLYLFASVLAGLSNEEILTLSENPWQLFKASPRRIFYSLPAAGSTGYLQLPRRHTSQPQGAVEVTPEWQNRVIGYGLPDVTLPVSDNSTRGVGSLGRSWEFAGTQQTRFKTKDTPTGPLTVVVAFRVDVFVNYGHLIGKQTTTTIDGFEIRCGAAATDKHFFIHMADNVTLKYDQWKGSGLTLEAGKDYVAAVSLPAAITAAPLVSINGGKVTMVNQGSTPGGGNMTGTSSDVYLGQRGPDAVTKLDGGIYFWAIFEGSSDIKTLNEISASPWQLFKAPPRRMFFNTGVASGTSYTITPSGGTTFGGSQHLEYTKIVVPSGGINLAGSVDITYTKVIVPSGGTTFGGTAPLSLSKTYNMSPSGGVQFAGTLDLIYTKIMEVSGGVSFGGSQHLEYSKTVIPDGGLSFGGTAPITTQNAYVITPDGGITFSGSPDMLYGKVLDTSGGITFGGSASLLIPSEETDFGQSAFIRRYIGRR